MSHKSIILIENDANLRQSIALILQRAGYLVTTADCTDKVVELLHSRKYHLLISDIDLPEIENFLLPQVMEAFPHLPIIVLTDQSSDEDDSVKKQLRTHYLIKPVAPERLLDSVQSILGNNFSNHTHNQVVSDHRI